MESWPVLRRFSLDWVVGFIVFVCIGCLSPVSGHSVSALSEAFVERESIRSRASPNEASSPKKEESSAVASPRNLSAEKWGECDRLQQLSEVDDYDALELMDNLKRCLGVVMDVGEKLEAADQANQLATRAFGKSFTDTYGDLWLIANYLVTTFNPTLEQKHDRIVRYIDEELGDNLRYMETNWKHENDPPRAFDIIPST